MPRKNARPAARKISLKMKLRRGKPRIRYAAPRSVDPIDAAGMAIAVGLAFGVPRRMLGKDRAT